MRTPVQYATDLRIGDEVTRPVTDAFRCLKEDHRHIARLMDRACETDEEMEETRRELWEEIAHSLSVHAEIEERYLYPRLEKLNETHDLALEAAEEHHVVKTLIEEIGHVPCDSEEWLAKLTVLKENVEHHVQEEEQRLFPDAQGKLDEDAQHALAEQFEEFLTAHDAHHS